MNRQKLGFLWVCLSVASALAQASPPSQTELNGFLLGQYATAADGTFGKPTQVTNSEDHWVYRVYIFDKQHNGYMAFKFPAEDEKRMLSIQVAGDAATPMRPFLGLSLGDDAQKVLKVLGKPDKIEPEKDYPVDLYTYEDRNYSVEVDKQGRLSSIQLMEYAGFPKGPPKEMPDVAALKKVLASKDMDGLLNLLAGDLEIYHGDQTFNFARSARSELADAKSEIHQLLLGEKGSVRTALMSEPFEPDTQIRVYEKAAPGSVVKFPKSRIVEEIVYKVEAGAWKIWEISLR